MSGRKDFLSQPAPENYVAGLGRGATGFTTRSDLGPAREGPSEEQMKELLAKRAAQLGQAAPSAYGAQNKKEEDDDDDRYQDAEDEAGLLGRGVFDRDDDEADRIYQDVDERMAKRRKTRRSVRPYPRFPFFHREPLCSSFSFLRGQIADLNSFAIYREAREIKEREEYERNNPKIQQQFADLKRNLSSISDEEWASIPEVGDLTGKRRRTKQNERQRFYAVPDSVLAGARDSATFETSVQDGGQTNGSSDQADGTVTNFADLGAARNKVLNVRLDQAAQSGGSDSVTGTSTSIDPKGYLTSLSKSEIKAGAMPVGDVKRAGSCWNPSLGPTQGILPAGSLLRVWKSLLERQLLRGTSSPEAASYAPKVKMFGLSLFG